MKSLMNNELISFTTRPIRKKDGEVDGKDYYFISVEEYNKMFDQGKLAEYTEYGGNYYGLTLDELESKLSRGHAFVIVDYVGVQQLKKIYNNCVSIILHTTKKDAIKQMKDRGDSLDLTMKRMSTYDEEIANKQYYDYAVINRYGEFDNTKKIVESIISVETGL